MELGIQGKTEPVCYPFFLLPSGLRKTTVGSNPKACIPTAWGPTVSPAPFTATVWGFPLHILQGCLVLGCPEGCSECGAGSLRGSADRGHELFRIVPSSAAPSGMTGPLPCAAAEELHLGVTAGVPSRAVLHSTPPPVCWMTPEAGRRPGTPVVCTPVSVPRRSRALRHPNLPFRQDVCATSAEVLALVIFLPNMPSQLLWSLLQSLEGELCPRATRIPRLPADRGHPWMIPNAKSRKRKPRVPLESMV